MSTPRFLRLPPNVRRTDIDTPRGSFAALEAYPSAGDADRDPALLVPGITGSKEDFLSVLQPLAEAGRQVVAIDMRGQYETPGSEDRAAYSCAALGADVAAVLDTLAGAVRRTGVHLLGHSFGGLVTRETVLDGHRVASFTLMSSGPSALTGTKEEEGRLLLAVLPELGLEQLWEMHFGPEAAANGVPPQIAAFLRERMLKNSVAGLRGMVEEILCAADRVVELADVSLPKLVLCGKDDDVWAPEIQAEMAARLDAEHVVLPDVGHSPAVDAPDATADALTSFWNTAERDGDVGG
ncbi:MAG: alpha/beta fold hydrolase [Streptosporangiales bacterium]|nr:alpha/beta fold hydrolase [Streptosporangiales bacterium]